MPTDYAPQVFYGTLPLVAAILLANWNSNKRLDAMNRRLDDMNGRFNDMGKRIDDFGVSLNKRIDDLATSMAAGFADVKSALAKLEVRVADLEKGTRVLPG